MLWKNIFYGPVISRRLGYSLGVNLLPNKKKICNFNCIYCECGLNEKFKQKEPLPTLTEFENALKETLEYFKNINQVINHITFSGNGEPTLHPDFDKIIDLTIKYRNIYYPDTKIAVLTNSTRLHIEKVYNALQKIDVPICKLDAGTEKQFQLIDAPEIKISLEEITDRLKNFGNKVIIQTIFLKGFVNNQLVDNTTNEELNEYVKRLKIIKPHKVMIYSIDRKTPFDTLEAISKEELEKIANYISSNGFEIDYYL